MKTKVKFIIFIFGAFLIALATHTLFFGHNIAFDNITKNIFLLFMDESSVTSDIYHGLALGMLLLGLWFINMALPAIKGKAIYATLAFLFFTMAIVVGVSTMYGQEIDIFNL